MKHCQHNHSFVWSFPYSEKHTHSHTQKSKYTQSYVFYTVSHKSLHKFTDKKLNTHTQKHKRTNTYSNGPFFTQINKTFKWIFTLAF